MHPLTHYEHLARLFDYPRWDYPSWVKGAYDVLSGRYVVAAAEIACFAQALPTDDDGPFSPDALDEVQELFTRTFDVQAITTLGVGYVMFGDDYKRGELLVNLSRELRDASIDPGTELPDHLPNVLRLMARWQDRDLAAEFAAEILRPALERMIDEFEPRRIDQRNALYEKHYKTLLVSSPNRATLFRTPLAAVLEVLKEDFRLGAWRPPEQSNDFLRSLDRELALEAEDSAPAPTGGRP